MGRKRLITQLMRGVADTTQGVIDAQPAQRARVGMQRRAQSFKCIAGSPIPLRSSVAPTVGVAGLRVSPFAATTDCVTLSGATACRVRQGCPIIFHMLKLQAAALMLAAVGASGAGMAGEAGSGRVLLQPPRVVIPSPITDRFAVNVSYAYPGMSAVVRYDNPNDPTDEGTPFYIEDTLGLADRLHMGWMDMMFRIGERHRFNLQYSQQTRTADQTLAQDIRFGGTDFAAGSLVHSELQQRKLDLIYTYSFLRMERLEMGLGLGLHLLQLYGAMEEPAAFNKQELDTAGPSASLAGNFTWRIFRRLSLNAQGQWLDGQVGDVRGTYVSWRANLQYRAARNMSVGLGYAGVFYELDSRDPDFFTGYLWMNNHGPEAFVRVSF